MSDVRGIYSPVEWHWKRMPTATLGAGAGITPVQNTWYTVLNAKNVRIKSIQLKQSNDEAAAKTLAIRGAVDGNAIAASSSAPANNVWLNQGLSGVVDSFPASVREAAYYVSLDAKSATVEIEITSALGTNQLLFASVQYEQLERLPFV